MRIQISPSEKISSKMSRDRARKRPRFSRSTSSTPLLNSNVALHDAAQNKEFAIMLRSLLR